LRYLLNFVLVFLGWDANKPLVYWSVSKRSRYANVEIAR